ncbi:DUF1016 N-terminal domain-containing protein [Arthrobacter sulfonylureivorans]|uniref:DUF1016 N-terminal domain-containing protein n=1 Tax=Arthrobacter sulfonylureivorans TaxID=2486855 RepID=UPI0030CB639A
MASREIALPEDYQDLLKVLKERVRGTRAQAVRTVNSQLIGLYWSIGRDILQRQDAEGWGSGVIARLAEDLRTEFPEMKGPSQRNLQYMRTMAEAGGARQMCHKRNCPGAISALFWIRPRPARSGTGMRPQGWSMGGPGTC